MATIKTNHCVNIVRGGTLVLMEAAVTWEIEIEEPEETPRVTGRASYLSTAEIAECTCPEACERDHDRD
jgi:hypothetical protein